MRKLLSLLLVLSLLLCGCSSESTTNSAATIEPEEVTTQAESLPEATTEPTPEPTTPEEGSTFGITFIDVGQADAAFIGCDGHYMLIDGGNKEDSNKIYSVLQSWNVEKLDIVVGTHAHEDHIGGLPGAYNYCSADITLSPVTEYDSDAFSDFAKYAELNGGGITVPEVGDTYSLGSATVTILGLNADSDPNNSSIVLRIDYGQTSFLFTGDAEREAEQAVLNTGANLSATVLKVGHHGSDTSTTYPFLREIMPQYAVISVGEGNSYGHPTEDTLSRLRDADATVFRTDMQGDIYCISDGKEVTIWPSSNADADVFGGIGNNSTVVEQTTPEPTVTPDPTPEPTPEPTPQPVEEEQNEQMVWIPNSGSKYHSKSSCSNMKNPSQVSISTAKSLGFTACKKCW